MSLSDDPTIFDAIRLDDKLAFERVFKESYRPLTSYAFRFVSDLPTAENIVQDVFLKLWKSRHHLVITTSLKHYLFRSVKNHCLNQLDKAKVRSGYLRMKLGQEHQDDDYSAFYPEIGLLEKIEAAIGSLPARRQEIFRLAREEGLKYREIAEQLNLSVKTVETQMTLALRQLRDSLKEYHHLVLFFIASDKGISEDGCLWYGEGMKFKERE